MLNEGRARCDSRDGRRRRDRRDARPGEDGRAGGRPRGRSHDGSFDTAADGVRGDGSRCDSRSPAQVALIDELAHTNVPGSRHEKRWEDVDALDVLGSNRAGLTDVFRLLVPTTDLTNQYHQALNCGLGGLATIASGPPLEKPGVTDSVGFLSGRERYRYPMNLPKVAATGGPQCSSLPVVPLDRLEIGPEVAALQQRFARGVGHGASRRISAIDLGSCASSSSQVRRAGPTASAILRNPSVRKWKLVSSMMPTSGPQPARKASTVFAALRR